MSCEVSGNNELPDQLQGATFMDKFTFAFHLHISLPDIKTVLRHCAIDSTIPAFCGIIRGKYFLPPPVENLQVVIRECI